MESFKDKNDEAEAKLLGKELFSEGFDKILVQ